MEHKQNINTLAVPTGRKDKQSNNWRHKRNISFKVLWWVEAWYTIWYVFPYISILKGKPISCQNQYTQNNNFRIPILDIKQSVKTLHCFQTYLFVASFDGFVLDRRKKKQLFSMNSSTLFGVSMIFLLMVNWPGLKVVIQESLMSVTPSSLSTLITSLQLRT